MFNKAQNVQNAQDVHQHMLSTFRDKPGIPRVRTVPDSPGRARRPPQGPAALHQPVQGHVVMPSPAQPSLTQPCLAVQGTRECARHPGSFKEPSQASRGKPGHVQAMWRAMLPMTVTSRPRAQWRARKPSLLPRRLWGEAPEPKPLSGSET